MEHGWLKAIILASHGLGLFVLIGRESRYLNNSIKIKLKLV